MRYHQSPSPSPESPQCRPRRSLRPSAPDRHPPTACQFPSLPSPAHLIRSHVSQAFNSYVYRENLKKRVKAGSPKALRARRKELEREEKKSNKRKAARELAARARPQPRPPKQKKCTADGRRRAVRDGQCEIVPGQCEGTCKDGKRCRIGPGSFPCAKPLNLGSEACSKSAASAAPGCSVLGPAAQAHFQIPPRVTGFVTQARVSARTTIRPSSLVCSAQQPRRMANAAKCSAGRPTATRSRCAMARSTAATTWASSGAQPQSRMASAAG